MNQFVESSSRDGEAAFVRRGQAQVHHMMPTHTNIHLHMDVQVVSLDINQQSEPGEMSLTTTTRFNLA